MEKLVLGLRECLYISCGYDNNMERYTTLMSDIPKLYAIMEEERLIAQTKERVRLLHKSKI